MEKQKFKVRRLSIRQKIIIPISFVLLIVCVLLGANVYRQVYYGMLEMGMEEAEVATDVAKSYVDGKIQDKFDSLYKDTQEYDTILKQLREVKKICGIKFLYIIYEENGKLFYAVDTDEDSDQALPGDSYNENYDELKTVFDGNGVTQDVIDHSEDGDVITAYKPVLSKDGSVVAIMGCDYDASDIVSRVNSTRNSIIEIGAVCFVAALIILIVIINRITNGLKKVDSKIFDIVNNEGDLTQKLEVHTGDELELIAGHVNQLLEYIRNIMQNISENSISLSSSADLVVNKLTQTSDSISDVSSVMEEMSAAMEETSASMQQVDDTVNNIASTIHKIADTASGKSEGAKQIASNAKSIYENALDEQINAKSQADNMIANIDEKIEKSKAVEQIDSLTQEIIGITEQTQLLALNASIEAARAGEAGKGFAVVAQEINKLAEDSEETANQINSVSQLVITAVNELAAEAGKMADFVEQVAMKGYDELLDNSKNYQNDVDRLSRVMDEFANQSESLGASIKSILETINAVNIAVEESAKGVGNVTETAVELTTNVGEIGKEADSNLNVAEQLEAQVKKFKL